MPAEPYDRSPSTARVLPLHRDRRDDPPALLLGAQLRRMREERRLTLEAAAAFIRGSASKVSRMERAESAVSERDVWDLVEGYGSPADERAEINELLRRVRRDQGKKEYSDVTPGFLRRLVRLEQRAVRVFSYEPYAVPGLLQTPEYARAMVLSELADEDGRADEALVERHVFARRNRWADFRDAGGAELLVIMDERALHWSVSDDAVMAGQLRRLLDLAETDGISIRVIPRDGGFRAPAPLAFTHLVLPDRPQQVQVVYVEKIDGADYCTDEARLEKYRARMERAMGLALSWEDSAHLMRRLVREKEAGER
jgi:transcriptional regulator with XRE-family HTH domain